MPYMIVEDLHEGEAVPVYRRVRDRGRLAPDGPRSWPAGRPATCAAAFSGMECDDERLPRERMASWNGIADFEVFPVIPFPPCGGRHRPAAVSG